MLLAFETVGRTASACMVGAGGSVLAHRDLGGAEAEHGLVSLLDGLIRDHGHPSRLAVAAGPGSFTGLRIGITAARTLAWLEGVPVAGIDSLAARAAEAGDGLWWVLLPLKRDTTFHALFRVAGPVIEVLAPTVAAADAAGQQLHPATAGATAIGPALTAKPGLAQRWCPGVAEGSPAALSARGVARVAAGVPAGPWDRLLPQYHQEPAPVLQRRAESSRRLLGGGGPSGPERSGGAAPVQTRTCDGEAGACDEVAAPAERGKFFERPN